MKIRLLAVIILVSLLIILNGCKSGKKDLAPASNEIPQAQNQDAAGLPDGNSDPNAGILQQCLNSCGTCEQNCKDSYFLQSAALKKDIALCVDIADEQNKRFCRDNIYSADAIEKKDASLCGKISEQFLAENCKVNVQTELAIESEDADECKTLAESQVQQCLFRFYNSMAIRKKDASYCDNLGGIDKDICENNVAVNAILPVPPIAAQP